MKKSIGKSPEPSWPHSRQNEGVFDIFNRYLRADNNDNIEVAGIKDEYVSYYQSRPLDY